MIMSLIKARTRAYDECYNTRKTTVILYFPTMATRTHNNHIHGNWQPSNRRRRRQRTSRQTVLCFCTSLTNVPSIYSPLNHASLRQQAGGRPLCASAQLRQGGVGGALQPAGGPQALPARLLRTPPSGQVRAHPEEPAHSSEAELCHRGEGGVHHCDAGRGAPAAGAQRDDQCVSDHLVVGGDGPHPGGEYDCDQAAAAADGGGRGGGEAAHGARVRGAEAAAARAGWECAAGGRRWRWR